MDLSTLVNDFGFPVAVAVFFIWLYYKQAKEHKDDLKNIAIKSVQSIDAATEAIKDSTKQIEKSNEVIRENTDRNMKLDVLRSNRGQVNGMGNGS